MIIKIKIKHIITMSLVLMFFQCTSLPETKNKYTCNKINSGAGPEDFVLDKTDDYTRILVSSHDRRNWKQEGKIFAIDLSNKDSKNLKSKYELKRVGEPKYLSFRPHGLDILTIQGKTFLYVITHGKEKDDADHTVSIYQVFLKKIKFLYSIKTKKFTSPNDLAVLPNGSFFVSNDTKKRGSLWEVLWRLKNADVVYCPIKISINKNNTSAEKNGNCQIAAKEISMPNGIAIRKNKVYISTTREDILYEFDNQNGKLINKKKVIELKGQDNLFWLTENKLLVANHLADYRFMRHASSKENISPSVVYEVDVKNKKAIPIYVNNGKQISAASGAFIYNNKLYISQVFDDFILECQKK